MRNENQRLFAGGVPDAEEAIRRPESCLERQRMRGIAGQLRPYRDVRAGFEPWRRVALRAWALREAGQTVH